MRRDGRPDGWDYKEFRRRIDSLTRWQVLYRRHVSHQGGYVYRGRRYMPDKNGCTRKVGADVR